jgi:SAM-dependent methyltransferase
MPYSNQTLARLYDLHWSAYAQRAAPLLREFFEGRPIARKNPSVLDLGCGTGHLALHFLETGCLATGYDLSDEMLFWARLHARRYVLSHQAHFERRDIRSFEVSQPFGMAVSTYNTLNHLSLEDLLPCFRSTARALDKGGWALLDLNTALGLSEWEGEERLPHPTGELRVSRSFDLATRTGELRLSGQDGEETFDERIENHTHSVERCLGFLQEAGFQAPYAARVDDLETSLPEPEKERRVFLVAER